MVERAPAAEPDIGEQLFGGGAHGAGLLGGLRAAGLSIGPRERVAVSALLAQLITASNEPVALGDLRPQLAPLLARSPSERETFFRVFDALAPTWRPKNQGEIEPTSEGVQVGPAAWWRSPGVIAWIGAGLLALLIGVLIAVQPRRVPAAAHPKAAEILARAPAPGVSQIVKSGRADTTVQDRLTRGATKYRGAPTLEELAEELAPSANIGWTPAAYAERLRELTGLPLHAPVVLAVGPTENTSAVLSRARLLLRAIGTLERPGAATVLDEAAFTRAIDPRAHRPDTAWRRRPPAPNAAFAPWWMLALSVGLPLIGGLAWLADVLRRRKAYLRRRRPAFPPLHMDLLADAAAQVQANVALFRRAGQRLARRTPRDTDRLDIERTVAATLGGGGRIVRPVFARARAAPDYLVLIEKRSAGDHDFARLRAMVRRLGDQVALEIRAYQVDPSRLEPEDGGAPESIDRVAAKYPDHRLLILGSGEGFLDPRGHKPTPAAEKLMRWERRALLTPLPLADWAREEILLARELDMPIGRATPEGIEALATLLGLDGPEDEERLRPVGDGDARPLPDILRLRGADLLYDLPPGPEAKSTIAQLVQDLRNYLDGPGFDWLCALAVYPAIQWDLTVFLGVALAERPGGAPQTNPLYAEHRLAALTQLPWFREGEMPNWLRRALIAAMSAPRAADVRAAIKRLLDEAMERPDEAENERIRFRISQEPIKEGRPPEDLFDDEVLLDFLARGRIEDFRFERPQAERPRRQPIRWARLAGLVVAGAYAAAAFVVTPKPWDGALVTGAWLPLALLALGAGLALAALNAAASYAAVRAWIERSAAHGLVFSFVVGGLWARSLSTFGLGAWEPLVFILGLAAAGLAARRAVEELGVYAPATERPNLRRVGMVAAHAATGVLALVGFSLAADAVGRAVLIAAGLAVFGAGVAAARFAPDRLPSPGDKVALETPRDRRTGAARAALAVLAIGPGLALAWWMRSAHPLAPPATPARQVPVERILAAAPDGRFFATGGADGVVRAFDAARPTTPLITIRMTGGPVISLAIADPAGRPLTVAAAAAEGTVRLFDGRGGSQVTDTGIKAAGSRPLIALGADGGWALATDEAAGAGVRASDDPAVPLATLAGGPITAIAPAAAGQYAIALSDGRVAVVGRGAFHEAALRLPGRVRSIASEGARLHAVGDDGSVLEAEIAPGGLVKARLTPPDPRLALGPAVPWRAPAPVSQSPVVAPSATDSGAVAKGVVMITTATPPGTVFRDTASGLPPDVVPQMVVIPAGSFVMGSPKDEPIRFDDEGPQHRVTIRAFAAGRFDVTFDEYDACVAAKGCAERPDDNGWRRGRRPVINVSWDDAQAYARWLSARTGQTYRLLTEAEWEYAARAGTTTAFSTGASISPSQAQYRWSESYAGSPTAPNPDRTALVGSFKPNPFGLYDMHGNVWQWVEDCYRDTYVGAPTNGDAVETRNCSSRVLRGGSWFNSPDFLRSAIRIRFTPTIRIDLLGFRLARTLSPPSSSRPLPPKS